MIVKSKVLCLTKCCLRFWVVVRKVVLVLRIYLKTWKDLGTLENDLEEVKLHCRVSCSDSEVGRRACVCVRVCVCVCVCVCARVQRMRVLMHLQRALVSASEQQVGLLRLSYKRLSKTSSVDHLSVCVCFCVCLCVCVFIDAFPCHLFSPPCLFRVFTYIFTCIEGLGSSSSSTAHFPGGCFSVCCSPWCFPALWEVCILF